VQCCSVIRRSRTVSCQAGVTVNRVLLGLSTWDACSLWLWPPKSTLVGNWGRLQWLLWATVLSEIKRQLQHCIHGKGETGERRWFRWTDSQVSSITLLFRYSSFFKFFLKNLQALFLLRILYCLVQDDSKEIHSKGKSGGSDTMSDCTRWHQP